MLKMSFYDGTLNREKAKELIEKTQKNITFAHGYEYRGEKRKERTKEKAIKIINNKGNYLDVEEYENEIFLNTFSSNDLF